MISTLPAQARYFGSRTAAMQDRKHGERVIRLGRFSNGSYGCYARQTSSGQYYGGANPLITVWMVVDK